MAGMFRARKSRLFVVEDHPITREGCVNLISTHADLEVVGEAAGVSQAMEQIRQLQPDAVLVDLWLEEGYGLDLVVRLAKECPNLPVLVWSARDEAFFAERALEAGARGFISKRALSRTLLEAIRAVLSDRTYLSEEVKDHLISRHYVHDSSTPLGELSNRELEIFEMIGAGQTVKVIAEQLCLSVKTVNSYRDRIRAKVGCDTSKELERFAYQQSVEDGAAAGEDADTQD